MIARLSQALAWTVRMTAFAAYFVWELVVASLDVARDVLSPRSRFSPGIIEFPLRCRTDFEITMMSNVITLTPGTLTLTVRSSPPTLYIHAMYASDRAKALHDLRTFEGYLLRAVRFDGHVQDPAEVDARSASGGGDA